MNTISLPTLQVQPQVAAQRAPQPHFAAPRAGTSHTLPLAPAFALLIGIDEYARPSGLPALRGSVNDACALYTLFRQRLNLPATHIAILLDDDATSEAVNDALARLTRLTQSFAPSLASSAARPQLWVAFAGYGSQMIDSGGALIPSLVLYDSRLPGGSDLPLLSLLAQLEATAQSLDVTLLLDCGHRMAGGGTLLSRGPQARACPPDARTHGFDLSERVRAHAVQRSAGGDVTVVAAAAVGAPVWETAVHDFEEQRWRGALTLAFEEHLLACVPTVATGAEGAACDLVTPAAVDLGRRMAAMGVAQVPVVWGSGATLRRARVQAATLAPLLTVQAEEAGLYWVDGGLRHGLVEGSRLYALDEAGEVVTLEVVELGMDRCGCASVDALQTLALPASAALANVPESASPSPLHGATPAVRLRGMRIQAPPGVLAQVETTTRDPGAALAARALLDAMLPEPAPEGLEVWPDIFAPVMPPDDAGGPVRLALSSGGLNPWAVRPNDPLRVSLRLSVPVGERPPASLLALAFDGVDFYPVARARLSPAPPMHETEGASAAQRRRGRTATSPAGRAVASASFHSDLLPDADLAVEHMVQLEIGWLPAARTLSTGAGQAVGRTLQLYLYTVADVAETTLGLFQVRHVPQAWTADVYPATFARPVAGGELRYTPALPARTGERVALLLHGFADDSAEEATWLLTHLRDAGVIYDRVLTFEYESLRTPVEENATRLAVALEQLGYGAQADSARGVTIDLFGHSMGALIGRWYVERLGGDAVIERSVFFGVPNEGTPLAAASLLAPWMLAAAINVARPALPSLVVAWALGTLALDVQGPADLRPGAGALAALARPPLPARTRYHLIAGDAALVPFATPEEEVTRARPARLLAALAGGAQAAASLFYGGAHDWAVSVQSALALRAGKAPGSTVMSFVAPTHHLGFFASPEVTRQVALWLATPEDAVG